MTTLTIFEFEARKGQGDELLTFFKRILPETRRFQGSKGAQASRLSDDKFIITAYWDNESDLGDYLSWREEQGDFSMLLNFLVQAPAITSYDMLDSV